MECFICHQPLAEKHLRRIMAINGKVYEMCPYATDKQDCLHEFMEMEHELLEGQK